MKKLMVFLCLILLLLPYGAVAEETPGTPQEAAEGIASLLGAELRTIPRTKTEELLALAKNDGIIVAAYKGQLIVLVQPMGSSDAYAAMMEINADTVAAALDAAVTYGSGYGLSDIDGLFWHYQDADGSINAVYTSKADEDIVYETYHIFASVEGFVDFVKNTVFPDYFAEAKK